MIVYWPAGAELGVTFIHRSRGPGNRLPTRIWSQRCPAYPPLIVASIEDPPVIVRSSFCPRCRLVVALALLTALANPSLSPGADRIRDLQDAYVENRAQKVSRAYHFGSQGPDNVFSNHTSHSNRLIPVYVFGRKADLASVTGSNSRYRDPDKIRALYGCLPEHTLNPNADYADQSDLYRVQADAAARGARRLITVWFDGLDWQTTQAAAIVKTGKVYTSGKGAGLVFQEDRQGLPVQYGFVVTSPTHDKNDANVDEQTVVIPSSSLGGGYDFRIAGPNPWTDGPLNAPGYLKGQSASAADKAGVAAVGGVIHAYTDSSQSAGEYVTGVKCYNNGVNVTDDGRVVPTLFASLQDRGWKVGTVTSVPFNHVSPAAMYAHNVHRDDYQDLARDMLGLPCITQHTGKDPLHSGLEVVMGTGYGQVTIGEVPKGQGKNVLPGCNIYITEADKAAIDVRHGGKYVVAQTEPGVRGNQALQSAADRAAREGHRLFGFYGTNVNHLPYRTADGNYDPAKGIRGTAEVYTEADRLETPTLADMTRAALTVLGSDPKTPFALFVEAGDVDFALHDNNLDNAIGAVLSGEEAVQVIIEWVESHGGWDDTVLIITADHGHYLVIDDLEALAGGK
jgi:alkaline phosphatase